MNTTPSANRVHIAFFGRRNTGKSSLVNAVTGQNLAIVSETKGTTTDPVYKAMELLPLGPVVIIDTPGFDDEGELGEMRVQKTHQVLRKTDIAILVLDGKMQKTDEELLELFKERGIPFIVVENKCDLLSDVRCQGTENYSPTPNSYSQILVSAKTGFNIDNLKEMIGKTALKEPENQLVADLVKQSDFIVLVIPIDKAAPKGRLILPQQQVIRGILDAGGIAISCKETELCGTLADLGKKPALVITDSQAFAQVSKDVPQEIPLTSFSILFARYKGFLETAVHGATALDTLQDGNKILICEGCTHHRQCDDIGTVKLPNMIKKHILSKASHSDTEAQRVPEFTFCSGGDFPQDLSPFKVVIHCGGCMLNEREMRYRQSCAVKQNVPFTNYGIAIAHMNGILERSVNMLI